MRKLITAVMLSALGLAVAGLSSSAQAAKRDRARVTEAQVQAVIDARLLELLKKMNRQRGLAP